MRAWLLSACALVGAAAFVSDVGTGELSVREAHATVSVLMSLEELVDASTRVAIVEPVERTSRWEEVAGSKRIVTYTKLVVRETIAGESDEEEVWVRTLGGKVGKIGQHVAGEAQFTLGERAVVFLAEVEGTAMVTGMAQGHYPLVDENGEVRLKSSPDTGGLVQKRGPRRSAREKLVGAKLGDATRDIKAAAKASTK